MEDSGVRTSPHPTLPHTSLQCAHFLLGCDSTAPIPHKKEASHHSSLHLGPSRLPLSLSSIGGSWSSQS